MKAGLFQCADGDHLLLGVHHAVVDGVSWRILMEDFALGYEQTGKSEEIRFPAKTDAYRTWSEQLAAYAQSPEMEKERAYWQAVDHMVVILPSTPTFRMRSLKVSAMTTEPAPKPTTPNGASSCAERPEPPSPLKPATPVPASTFTNVEEMRNTIFQ